MLFSIIKWIIISLTLIFLIHHLYIFLMDNLTVPKIKDLVNKPNEQYKDIFATLERNNQIKPTTVAEPNMTDELTQFFNELKKTSEPEAANVQNSSNTTTSLGELPNSIYTPY